MNKKSNKPVIIVAIVCATLVLALILTFALADTVAAHIKMSEFKDNISSCERAVISDPLYSQNLSYGSEIVLEGDDAAALKDRLLSAIDKISFKQTVSGIGGFWDTRISFYTSEHAYSIYLTENSVYIAASGGYLFEIDEECQSAYEELYSEIRESIKGAVANATAPSISICRFNGKNHQASPRKKPTVGFLLTGCCQMQQPVYYSYSVYFS